ncbi:hypothetical protein BJX66DRAFT_311868 [Aspergillus keveii]|uniref:Uncharacterized protein n=1 Tax=Aspergillus keveii TaxID=714993 RepID=A0ABR4FVH0_9EURO
MWETIIAAYKVTLGQPCQHPRDSPLDCVIPDRVITTSMAAPTSGPRDDRVSVVQVARNATAQFLACSGALAILQKHCCLNCAYKEAVGDSERRVRMVIAG